MNKNWKNMLESMLRRRIHAPEKADIDMDEIEDWLWMYAELLLSEEEEAQVTEWIARHPEVEKRVDQIRETIDSASQRSWLVSLACARAAAKRMVASVGLTMSQVSGFVAKAERGLGVLFPTPEPHVAQPVMLGDEQEKAASAPLFRRRVDFPEKQGLRVFVMYTPDGAINLIVKALLPPVQGEVRVTVAADAKDAPAEEITAWMRKGHANVEDCPMGLLKVEAPGNRIQHVYLQELDEPVSDERKSKNG